jgi:hypothetical protein
MGNLYTDRCGAKQGTLANIFSLSISLDHTPCPGPHDINEHLIDLPTRDIPNNESRKRLLLAHL